MKNTKPKLDMFQQFVAALGGEDACAYINEDKQITIMPKDIIPFLDDTHRTFVNNISDFFKSKADAENWEQCYRHMLGLYTPAETTDLLNSTFYCPN